MCKRLLLLLTIVLLLGACTQINTLSENPIVPDITNAAFYVALQTTVASVQIPVIIVGVLTLIIGWKLGRFGLALNAALIGGLILYTLLNSSGWIPAAAIMLGLSVVGGVIIGLLAYFLYNLMALIIGGAIGMMLMNGAWWQIAANVPPMILVFITTFVSALVMFVVFRLFLVAFSAVIGAVILMLAVPFPTLWVIPVAIAGMLIQTVIAFFIHDDIFQNLRGDFGAALSEAFGEVLGPFGVLRERQQSNKSNEKPVRQQSSKPAPEPRPAVRQQPEVKPVQPQYPAQIQRPAPQPEYKPSSPPAQPTYKPAQPPQAASVSPQNKPIVQPASNPQPPVPFRPDDFLLTLPNGQGIPLVVGAQFTIGRNPDSSIVINDAQISGTHTVVSIQADSILVWDNNSTNGTYLNGVLLTGSHRLTPADVLQVGSVVLRLTRRIKQ
jgi:pSer/pThr/pTyr-binding forkhead associated (FHA) protein